MVAVSHFCRKSCVVEHAALVSAGALQHGHPAYLQACFDCRLLSAPVITPPAPPLACRQRIRFLADLEKDGWELMEAVRARTGWLCVPHVPANLVSGRSSNALQACKSSV